ncbi:hypothetical protein MXB_2861 [Myxobolus squamalis]|nr:hypothetical protein MXB_2861 [Myxobolus squamalis]
MDRNFVDGLKLGAEVLGKNHDTASHLVISSCFYNLGCLLEARGNFDEAKNCFTTAFKLSHNLDERYIKEMTRTLRKFKYSHT